MVLVDRNGDNSIFQVLKYHWLPLLNPQDKDVLLCRIDSFHYFQYKQNIPAFSGVVLLMLIRDLH